VHITILQTLSVVK
jgi:hypothetical protein